MKNVESDLDFDGKSITIFLSGDINEKLINAITRSGRSKKKEATLRLIDAIQRLKEVKAPENVETSLSSTYVTCFLPKEINQKFDVIVENTKRFGQTKTRKDVIAFYYIAEHLNRFKTISEIGEAVEW